MLRSLDSCSRTSSELTSTERALMILEELLGLANYSFSASLLLAWLLMP